VLASLDIGHMMLTAGMSFLGLGVSAPTAEWG
jgi:ABC-type dipeptide/oligopeptide/nickel transport system permease subunit